MGEPRITIGELGRRTGLATSALRYYEELGLLPAPTRVSGQRRYDASVVQLVGVIILLRDVGFGLAEISDLFAMPDSRQEWRAAAHRKLDELDEQIRKTQVARVALEHLLRCRHADVAQCPNFLHTIAGRLAGKPLEDAHTH
jgi:MerR family redox-sensitive transcriptional activator SoxR